MELHPVEPDLEEGKLQSTSNALLIIVDGDRQFRGIVEVRRRLHAEFSSCSPPLRGL